MGSVFLGCVRVIVLVWWYVSELCAGVCVNVFV